MFYEWTPCAYTDYSEFLNYFCMQTRSSSVRHISFVTSLICSLCNSFISTFFSLLCLSFTLLTTTKEKLLLSALPFLIVMQLLLLLLFFWSYVTIKHLRNDLSAESQLEASALTRYRNHTLLRVNIPNIFSFCQYMLVSNGFIITVAINFTYS